MLADPLEHAVRVPRAARRARCFLPLSRCRVADDAWDEARQSGRGVDVLPDLDRDDFCRAHLLVQELNDPSKLCRDPIRDEHHSNSAALEIRSHRFPERLNVAIDSDERPQGIERLDGLCGTVALVCSTNRVDGPVDDCVRRVVEQLPDDLSSNAGVAAAFTSTRVGIPS